MTCECTDPKAAAEEGTLKCFLIAEDHLWITTAWHLCLECHRIWCEDEKNGWSGSTFEEVLNPNVWVTGFVGAYPRDHLTDIETFARWVKKLKTPYHTNPMV